MAIEFYCSDCNNMLEVKTEQSKKEFGYGTIVVRPCAICMEKTNSLF